MYKQRLERVIAGIRNCFCILRNDGGQALVEFALVLPILMMIAIGILEFGRAWNTYQVITDAAREGARNVVVAGSTATGASVTQIVNDALTRARLNTATLSTTNPCPTGPATAPTVCLTGLGAATGTPASVQIRYPYRFTFLGRLLDWTTGQSNITLRTTFVMRNE